MRIAMLLVLLGFYLCGCSSGRYAGRYGDGVEFNANNLPKTFRKFYMRSIHGDGAFVSPVTISHKYPTLFASSIGENSIPIDVYTKKVKRDDGGHWSLIFAFAYSIIPSWFWTEEVYSIQIIVDGDAKNISESTCVFNHHYKCSVFSPLGLIPYGNKEGFQCNETKVGVLVSVPDVAKVLEDVMAGAIAQHVSKYAMDKLEVPDIRFDEDVK